MSSPATLKTGACATVYDVRMTRYCLKAMVLARLFAEATVLIAFISAPIVLLSNGRMSKLDMPVQVFFYFLAAIGVILFPCFGFLTWQVRVDDKGLTADALFKHQFCSWDDMKRLTRRASWNWQRYVIEFSGGSLHFPVLLARCDELVRLIRQKMQDEPGATGVISLGHGMPHRVFNYDPIAMVVTIGQAVVACVFVGLFWFFFAFNLRKQFHSNIDAAMIFGFCLAASIVFLWRLIVVLRMPNRVELTRDQVIFKGIFVTKIMQWSDVISIKSSIPLLPEGVTIKSKKGQFLIGTGMDSADELQEIVLYELANKDKRSAASIDE
ncbi:MAG TPA: hypothetical protein V6C97_08130 [Oculatellaceae cyanobacterium]